MPSAAATLGAVFILVLLVHCTIMGESADTNSICPVDFHPNFVFREDTFQSYFPIGRMAIGIGPPKTSTGAINSYVINHSNVAGSPFELFYFIRDRFYFNGLHDYKNEMRNNANEPDVFTALDEDSRQHFLNENSHKSLPETLLYYEKTPLYAADQLAPYRMLTSLGPQTLFIFNVRNFFDSVVSMYIHCHLSIEEETSSNDEYTTLWIKRAIEEQRSYEECAVKVASRILGVKHVDYLSVVLTRDFSSCPAGVIGLESVEMQITTTCGKIFNRTVLSNYFYPLTFARYRSVFGDSNIFISFFEEFVRDPAGHLESIFEFLQLPAADRELLDHANKEQIKFNSGYSNKKVSEKSRVIRVFNQFLKPYLIEKCAIYRDIIRSDDYVMLHLLEDVMCSTIDE